MTSFPVARTLGEFCKLGFAKNCSRTLSTTALKCQESSPKEQRKKPFPVIDGEVDTTSTNFTRNLDVSTKLLSKYEEVLTKSKAGGGEKAILRHVKQNKKLLPMDRVRLLLDNVEDFLELSPIAGHAMEYGDVARAGVITGR